MIKKYVLPGPVYRAGIQIYRNKIFGAAGTFATTYAIGQVAQAYYGGGRRLDGGELKRLFAAKSGEAQGLYQQYRGEIESRSRSINLQELLPMIRGA